jgi:hypothetical protein
VFARELRRAGIALGADWDDPLKRMREYSERARAEWFLSELAKITA